MKSLSKTLVAIFMIALGVLFLVFKGEVVSIAMTVLGIGLIVSAVIDFIRKDTVQAIVKLVIGCLVLICGWTLLSAALYIMAAALLLYGVLGVYATVKEVGWKLSWKFLEPVLMIIIAVCLFFNQGGTLSWLFIVVGIGLIVYGILGLAQLIKKK